MSEHLHRRYADFTIALPCLDGRCFCCNDHDLSPTGEQFGLCDVCHQAIEARALEAAHALRQHHNQAGAIGSLMTAVTQLHQRLSLQGLEAKLAEKGGGA